MSEELRILIASGATGGTSEGSVGKYFHLKDFGEAWEWRDISRPSSKVR